MSDLFLRLDAGRRPAVRSDVGRPAVAPLGPDPQPGPPAAGRHPGPVARQQTGRPAAGGQGRQRGFTLLEVLISLAILASALTILLGTMANSGQQAVFSNELTTASMLARSKMVDLEYELMEQEFPEGGQRLSGDFRDEGREDITWEAAISPVEIPESSKEQFLAQVNSQLFGEQSQGALEGNAAFSAMLPMLIGQLPEMINTIGLKIRRVELRVEFEYGGNKFPLELIQYVADPNLREFGIFGDTGTNDTDPDDDLEGDE